MNWKQSRAKARLIGSRTRAFVFGGILGASGGAGLYTETTHYLRAIPVTATILERRKECKVEYQIVGKERTRTPMSCDAAEALQNRAGANKVKIDRTDLVRLHFQLADGAEHEATVDEFNLGSYSQPVGAKLAVAYDPGNPDTVRAALTWDRVKIPLGLIAVGLGILALGFLGPIRSVFRSLRGVPPDKDALPRAARLAVKAQSPVRPTKVAHLPHASLQSSVRGEGNPPTGAGLHSEHAERSAIGTHTSNQFATVALMPGFPESDRKRRVT